ncbi:MAG: MBL fold metallo-hydrolase [Planctomycetes bacterium]|nr:MBL fold metallo-hydrolase [Planctomycetota bacterium]
MLKAGPFEIYSVQTGTFRLDGGAMFGVVPKTLWSQPTPCDELNRIYLSTRTLIAVDRANRRVVIADTGCGSKWSTKEADRFAIQHDGDAITRALSSLGLTNEDITDVVVTHLHFDHNGGLTDWADKTGGKTVPKYPRATHWLHRKHWEHAQSPTLKDRASFLRPDFEGLYEAGLLKLVEGDGPPPPFEGLAWFLSHGHTTYHLHPLFGAGRERVLFIGDLVPTAAHLRLPWVMAYDLRPLVTIQEKEDIFRHCLDDGWVLAFAHDPAVAGTAIDGTPDRAIASRPLPLEIS